MSQDGSPSLRLLIFCTPFSALHSRKTAPFTLQASTRPRLSSPPSSQVSAPTTPLDVLVKLPSDLGPTLAASTQGHSYHFEMLPSLGSWPLRTAGRSVSAPSRPLLPPECFSVCPHWFPARPQAHFHSSLFLAPASPWKARCTGQCPAAVCPGCQRAPDTSHDRLNP